MYLNNTKVLVTGGNGFLAVHCILQLLQAGYSVRTTVRNVGKRESVINQLKTGGIKDFSRLEFAEADLMKDEGWERAIQGCRYVLHVASPITLKPMKEEDFVRPAVEGALRVLKAAKSAGVQRVVMTSNFGAIGYSHRDKTRPITEEEWTDPNEKGLSFYNKSKTLAERAAWDFIKRSAGDMELAVVNPVGIFGPALGPELSSGFELLRQVLDGSMKRIPNITLTIVDVRDVVDLHIRAMNSPDAAGERFLAIGGRTWTLPEIAQFYKKNLGDKGARVSDRILPDWIVKISALFSPVARNLAPMVSRYRNASHEKATNMLGWKPRPDEEALMATAHSLIRYGHI